MKNEMRGLASIIANAGTLHAVAEPPDREDFGNELAYDLAYHEWFVAMNYWRAEAKP